MGFSKQEYWNGFPFHHPWDLSHPWIKSPSPTSAALQAASLPLSHWGSPKCNIENLKILKYMKMIIMCIQISSVTQSCTTQGDLMDCSTPGFPVHHRLPELTQTHVHWVGDAIKPSHPLSSPSPPSFNLSQYRGLFKWVSSLHQVARVLEFQLQHQSFQWMFRTDFC